MEGNPDHRSLGRHRHADELDLGDLHAVGRSRIAHRREQDLIVPVHGRVLERNRRRVHGEPRPGIDLIEIGDFAGGDQFVRSIDRPVGAVKLELNRVALHGVVGRGQRQARDQRRAEGRCDLEAGRLGRALEVQVLRGHVVVDRQIGRLSAGPIAVIRHALNHVAGAGDVRCALLEVRVGVQTNLAQGQSAIVDRHAEDLAVEVIEEGIRAFAILGAVADTDHARQEDRRVDARLIDAVDIEGRRSGGFAGDEDQMSRHAGIGRHAIVIVGHAEGGRAVGPGVVPLLVLESHLGVAEISATDQAHAGLRLVRIALDDELIGHLAAEGADVIDAVRDVGREVTRLGCRGGIFPGRQRRGGRAAHDRHDLIGRQGAAEERDVVQRAVHAPAHPRVGAVAAQVDRAFPHGGLVRDDVLGFRLAVDVERRLVGRHRQGAERPFRGRVVGRRTEAPRRRRVVPVIGQPAGGQQVEAVGNHRIFAEAVHHDRRPVRLRAVGQYPAGHRRFRERQTHRLNLHQRRADQRHGAAVDARRPGRIAGEESPVVTVGGRIGDHRAFALITGPPADQGLIRQEIPRAERAALNQGQYHQTDKASTSSPHNTPPSHRNATKAIRPHVGTRIPPHRLCRFDHCRPFNRQTSSWNADKSALTSGVSPPFPGWGASDMQRGVCDGCIHGAKPSGPHVPPCLTVGHYLAARGAEKN